MSGRHAILWPRQSRLHSPIVVRSPDALYELLDSSLGYEFHTFWEMLTEPITYPLYIAAIKKLI